MYIIEGKSIQDRERQEEAFALSELTQWKKQQIDKLKMDMARLFSRPWPDFRACLFPYETADEVCVNLSETDDSLIVNAVLPEIDPSDLKVFVTGDNLIISGKKQEHIVEKDTHIHRVEKRLSSFTRTIRLPCKIKVGEIEATYHNMGMLNIVMPKWKAKQDYVIKIKIK